MKNLIILVLVSVFSAAITVPSFAQKAFFNKNVTETFTRKIQTTNATATDASTIIIGENEVGHIEIKTIGFSPDSVAAVTGIRTYRYQKINGVLTLGSAIETLPIIADTKVSGGTFAAVASGNNIIIRVTGKASVLLYWDIVIKQRGSKRS